MKNPHIFDYWYEKEPWQFHGESAPIGCDKYTCFQEDSRLMKQLGHTSFITSIQWSRLIRNYETAEINEDGLRFYNAYIDSLIEQGIEPILFLMLFDMPYELQELGGWENKRVIEIFVKYAERYFQLFGNRIWPESYDGPGRGVEAHRNDEKENCRL